MTIFIAPIGTHPDFVKTWLKEKGSDVTKLWLIHSPVGREDFPKKAKKLASELKKVYDIEIERKVMSDAFTIDPVMDAITEIINQEDNDDMGLSRKENIVINITGGTNIVAAGAMNSATYYQTKCHYVLQKQDDDPKNKKLVREVPITPKLKSDLNESQLKVLKTISDSKYSIPNTPKGLESEIIIGTITNNSILKKLGWDKKQKGTRNRSTRLSEILKVLKKNKLVERIGSTEMYQLPNGTVLPYMKNCKDKTCDSVGRTHSHKFPHGIDAEIDDTSKKLRVKVTIKNEPKFYPWPLPIVENTKSARWIITAEGRRESKNQFLKLE
jgi:hypothetical protein